MVMDERSLSERSGDKYIEAIKHLTHTARQSEVQREFLTPATGTKERCDSKQLRQKTPGAGIPRSIKHLNFDSLPQTFKHRFGNT